MFTPILEAKKAAAKEHDNDDEEERPAPAPAKRSGANPFGEARAKSDQVSRQPFFISGPLLCVSSLDIREISLLRPLRSRT